MLPLTATRNFFRTHWKILLIVILAFSVRCFHLSFGLPETYLEDEEFFIQPALRVAEHLTSFSGLDPHWYGAPAQTLIYLLAIVFRFTNVCVNMAAHTAAPVSVNAEYYTRLFVTLARLIPATAGALSVWVMFCIGKKYTQATGLIAALILTCSFFAIEHGHIIRPDVLQTFFLLLVILSLFQLFTQHTRRWYVALGVFLAFAVTTKYPSLYLLPVIVVCACVQLRAHWTLWRSWCLALVAFVGGLLLSGPFLFLNSNAVLHAIRNEAEAAHAGHDGLSFFGNVSWYLCSVMPWQLGTGFLVIALLGVGVALREKQTRHYTAILLSASLCYGTGISLLALHWERWWIPVVTFSILFVAVGIAYLWTHLPRLFSCTIILLICVAPGVRMIRTLSAYTRPNTYHVAMEAVRESVPVTAHVVREPYTPNRHNAFDVTIPNASMMTTRQYAAQNTQYVFLGAVYQRIRMLAESAPSLIQYTRAADIYRTLIERNEAVFALSAFPDTCLRAPDWTVLLSHCPHPFFGEDQYIIRLRPQE